MDGADDLKDFGLAVLSLLVASVPEADAVDPAVAELSALAAALPPCGLFQSWDVDCSARPTASLVLDGTYEPAAGAQAVDGGAVIVTASSAKSTAFGAAKALGRTGGHWQAVVDSRTSWFQLQLERPTYLESVELEWKWGSPVRTGAARRVPHRGWCCGGQQRSPARLATSLAPPAAPGCPADLFGVCEL